MTPYLFWTALLVAVWLWATNDARRTRRDRRDLRNIRRSKNGKGPRVLP